MYWWFLVLFSPTVAVTEKEILIRLELQGDVFNTPSVALYIIKECLPKSDWDLEQVERETFLIRLPTYVPYHIHELMMVNYDSSAESHASVVSMVTAYKPKHALIYTDPDIVSRIATVWYEFCIRSERDSRLEKFTACYPDIITFDTGEEMEGWVLSTNSVNAYLKKLLKTQLMLPSVIPTRHVDAAVNQDSSPYPSDNDLAPDYLTDESLADTLDDLLNDHSCLSDYF
jgi:hypothetical protein